jgi:hypothetical protein
MSIKTKTKSNLLKNYDECLKQGITIDKVYGSDFTDGFIIKRYLYPPYLWNTRGVLSDTMKRSKQRKPERTVQKKKRLIKSKSVRRSKSTKKK